MPRLDIDAEALTVRFNWWETLSCFRRSLRIPLAHIRGATEDEGFRGFALGLRMLGTGIPGVLSAGIYRRQGDYLFVFLTRNAHPVVIELANEPWTRLVLGFPDARNAVRRINGLLGSS